MRPLLILLALGACTATDPLYTDAAWHPVGANDANLRAMIADPQDLLNGAPSAVADGGTAADAVARLRAGKVKDLPDSGLAKITLSGGGGSAATPSASLN